MIDYQFIVNPNEEQYPLNFESFWFNEKEHLLSQAISDFWRFFLIKTSSQTAEARINIFKKNNLLVSPFRAPFGGIEFSPNLSVEAVYLFISELEDFCKNQPISSLRITQYPMNYALDNSHILTHIFLQRGFEIIESELNYDIMIGREPFDTLLHISEKRRLSKCLKANFTFSKWENPDLDWVYHFVKNSRDRKGYAISLNQTEFKSLCMSFPQHFQVFILKDKDVITALSVVVKINSHILYNFYPADNAEYLNYSPMVMLIAGIYQYAQQNEYRLLDLGGASTLDGIFNWGLNRFKRYLGAKPSLKLVFQKNF